MKYVIIVNGKPGSGKTTFENRCSNYLDETEYAYGHIISSVGPIKEIYEKLGWNGEKTEKARKDLSTLKQMWIDNCNGPIRYVVNYILELSNDDDHVVFVDIREESEIIALREVLDPLQVIDIRCTTLLIERPDNDGLEYGNKSDDMVGSNRSIYDVVIKNDSTLEHLSKFAETFINKLLEERL